MSAGVAGLTKDAVLDGITMLGQEFPGWNFSIGRVVPGWEAVAVQVGSGRRVTVHAPGPMQALVMVEAAVKAVPL